MKYAGPKAFINDVAIALDVLHRTLSVTNKRCGTHSLIRVQGIDRNADVIDAIAVYLVAVIAGCIDYNLQVREALFGKRTLERELHRDVKEIIGTDNNLSLHKRTHERDPWLWEGISHLLIHLSVTDNTKHPHASVLAKSAVHLSVKDHGLDVIALYGPDPLGVTCGECKAYVDRAGEAVADAATRLAEVDGTARDAEIRQTLGHWRGLLDPAVQQQITGAFWKGERAYFPMVCCDSNSALDWEADREVLRRLKRPLNRKYLVPAAIPDARQFFDHLADAMRRYAEGKL